MPRIVSLQVSAHTVPTDAPEGDGTLRWERTTMVLVRVEAAGRRGIGYTYGDVSDALLIRKKLAGIVQGAEAMDIPRLWRAMQESLRNTGRPGLAAHAVSAIDAALWDLKAKLLELPLVTLLGQAHDSIPVYGSGGFTTYSMEQLERQLGGWAERGFGAVKMKIGANPGADPRRVAAARRATGPDVDLYVDANGALQRKQALAMAESFAEQGVSWFEEPVSSDDLDGLRLIRDRGPAGMAIAAGEYGYTPGYFQTMLRAGAVDVLQVDATRALGITGFLRAAALAEAYHVPLSAHTAPALHLHPCCALPGAWNIEYFHDHVRIEEMLFDGAAAPRDGRLRPDLSRPGLGLEPKEQELERFAA